MTWIHLAQSLPFIGAGFLVAAALYGLFFS